MTNRPFRPFDHERDINAVKRIFMEVGWLDDNDDALAVLSNHLLAGETEVATINDEAECSVHWTPGTIQYQAETLLLGIVASVTTSHIARKLGFAKELTARSLARQFDQGMAVSALGMFDQGFYNKVGYGTGSYEHIMQFDPATLQVDHPFRPPTRLSSGNFADIHHALVHRQKFHGSVVIYPASIVEAEMCWTEHPFGLGYFDGPDKTLTHFIWGTMKGEHGPYEIAMRAYQNPEQLMELLALIKSLGDQVNSFRVVEFGEIQLQDLLRQPFRIGRSTKGGIFEQSHQTTAFWQMRILNLEACLASTHLPGPGVRFNLALTDPVTDILAGESHWAGLTGNWVITLGEESKASIGVESGLPTLRATVNAFSRMWLGVRPASSLAVTDELQASPGLLAALDQVLRLPEPHCGWEF